MGKPNPLKWNCETQGCFNVKHRPKIEMFADILPRNIAFGDIDQTVEINGHFLFMEWKSGESREIPTGQEIYAKQLTRQSPNNTYVVVFGDCEAMTVSHIQVAKNGRFYDYEDCTMTGLRSRIAAWVRRVEVF